MTYMLLSDLSPKQQASNVKVKVIRLWESINNKREELMSLHNCSTFTYAFVLINSFCISFYCSIYTYSCEKSSGQFIDLIVMSH
jgi:hypothetical protein